MSQFDRNVWCLLGLPFDVITFDRVVSNISGSVKNGTRCFFSTPNMNFLVESQNNEAFRRSVINSDLSLMDGMPIVWIAALLGIPGVEKVSGSNLFEALWLKNSPDINKMKVFLFGGEEGVAEKACSEINNRVGSGIRCVGFHNPGFVPVEEMSGGDIQAQINDSNADFVVVALGAQKGQAWIERNLASLDPPVISHLGAVINFAAGQVARAPAWMQRTGLEWVWRIVQEPTLWRRYIYDGKIFTRLLFTRVIPYVLWKLLQRKELNQSAPVKYHIEQSGKTTIIFLQGSCLYRTVAPLRNVFAEESAKGSSIVLDLTDVPVIDAAFIGLCLVLLRELNQAGDMLSFRNSNRAVKQVFRWNCTEYLL